MDFAITELNALNQEMNHCLLFHQKYSSQQVWEDTKNISLHLSLP